MQSAEVAAGHHRRQGCLPGGGNVFIAALAANGNEQIRRYKCGQSSAAFASWRVPSLRKLPFAIRAFRISPTETVALGIDARRSQAHCQSGRGLPALQDAGATAEPLPIFRALPSSSDPNWSLLQRTRLHCGRAVGAERLSPTGGFIGSLRRISREASRR